MRGESMFVKSSDTSEMLEAILGSIDEGIHAVDADGITIFYNESASRHDGVEIGEVLSRHILDVFPSLNKETSTLLKVARDGKPIYQQSQTYTNIRGELIDTVNTTLPIKKDGAVIGAVEIAKDFSTVRRLSQKLLDLQAKIERKDGKPSASSEAIYSWNDVISVSEKMEQLKKHAEKAAKTSSAVLIYGETGTGKELLVQSIHNASQRARAPFIAQNCAALPSALLESILFGTMKGSFTGAIDRPGLFELAHGGTLFLDEINSMPLDIQAKLLRVLENGVIRRVGGTKSYACDVRIIAALNEPPLKCVEKNSLRRDLYYRLNVFNLEVPPLRERKEDIAVLVDHFMKKYNYKLGKLVTIISKTLLQHLENQHWPGNVRELQHAVEYAMNMTEGDTLSLEHLPQYLKTGKPKPSEQPPFRPLRETLEQTEIVLIKRTLEETGGNILQAAKRLEVPRQTLQYKLKKYRII